MIAEARIKPAADPHNSILTTASANSIPTCRSPTLSRSARNSLRSAASFSQKAQSEGDEATDDQLRQVWRV